ncbi:MAG: hypothetical protein HY675_14610 [Chloroflexi bacterium]|nr:hypothetical protein [Chloroflexota bacterium]
MSYLAFPALALLHGQLGAWDDLMYVVAALAGVALFAALVIAKRVAPKE